MSLTELFGINQCSYYFNTMEYNAIEWTFQLEKILCETNHISKHVIQIQHGINAIFNKTNSHQIKSNQIKSNQIKSNQIKSNHIN
jgi:hypothetical protein